MEVILIFFFMFLSAFFSSSEMVLLTLSKFEIKQIAKQKKYRKLIVWITNPAWFITGILAGNNIVNIGFGSVYSFVILTQAEKFKVNLLLSNIFIFFTAAILMLIFGEIMPKNLAKSKADKLIRVIYSPLIFFMYLVSPLIFFFHFFEKYIIRTKHKESPDFTLEDMHDFVEMIEEVGVIEEESEEMIHSFLKLRTQKVKEIMTPNSEVLSIDIEKEENIFAKAHELGRSRIPVYRGDFQNIEGLLYAKDLAGMLFRGEFDLHQFLRSPLFVQSSDDLKFVFRLFQESRKHIAFVQEDNQIIGIITLEDILEEVIGDVLDEYEND
ncbi:MAG: DUF21 domain-containing protein [bacterium]|nr:DUF21 domain-containing protein [bacterium]